MDFSDLGGRQIDFSDLEALPPPISSSKKGKLQSFLDQYSNVPDNAGFLNRKTRYLQVPEQMASEGLKGLTNIGVSGQNKLAALTKFPIGSEPTGNLPRDIIFGTPKIVGETLAETAPGFVSRGAILSAAAGPVLQALGKPVNVIRQGIERELESASGIGPKAEGALEAHYQDPSLLFSKGREAAKEIYGAAKQAAGSSEELTNELLNHKEVIEKAADLLKEGNLNPSAAQTARKSVDALMNSRQYPKETLLRFRNMFDQVAKSNENLSEADRVFQRATYADAIRHLLPQNKYGGTSAFKTLLLMASPTRYGEAITLPLLSPMLQGIGAAGAGIAARAINNPGFRTTLAAALSNARRQNQ